MNKKVVKYVLIVSGIVLLLGLGIWGYKYIKNRNDDKKTNENENQLKEVESLTSYGNDTVGSYSLNYYYNGPLFNRKTCILGSVYYSTECIKRDYYLTIYINNSIKLKSSWMFYSYEAANVYIEDKSIPKTIRINNNVLNSKFLIISLSYNIFCDYNVFVNKSNYFIYCDSASHDTTKTYYPYTKVFDATTGDMIFAVPTNSNEKITITGTFDGVSSGAFKNNMCLTGTSAIYYLKSNYTLTDGNNVEVHKVQFDDSYDNKYNDTIIAYTKGTIETNS